VRLRRLDYLQVLVYAALLAYAAVVLYPLFVLFMQSFKSTREIFTQPFALPRALDFGNYAAAWASGNFRLYFLNSAVITSASVALTLFLSSMTGFVLSRFQFRLRPLVILFLLSGIMIPTQLAVLPLYLLLRSLLLLNTHLGLILVYVAGNLSFSTFLLLPFFQSLPKELDDAARLDGCTAFGLYWRVLLPLIRPGLAAVGIWNFVGVWNDFFFPLVFTSSPSLRTIPLGLSAFFGEYGVQWNLLFAALSIAVTPLVVVYALFSRNFMRGLTAGAVK
jgi:raffinose/stachyose/melibiose transport system permease protein